MTDENESTGLDDLEAETIAIRGHGERLEYVLRTLENADELASGLTWSAEVWPGCTVEELIGGLIEADLLRAERVIETMTDAYLGSGTPYEQYRNELVITRRREADE